MSSKLKIQQSPAYHQDPDAGKLRHEDDEYWNFHWRGHVAYTDAEIISLHESYDAPPAASNSSPSS